MVRATVAKSGRTHRRARRDNRHGGGQSNDRVTHRLTPLLLEKPQPYEGNSAVAVELLRAALGVTRRKAAPMPRKLLRCPRYCCGPARWCSFNPTGFCRTGNPPSNSIGGGCPPAS